MRPVLYTVLIVLSIFALAIGCKKDDEQKPNPICRVTCIKRYPQFSFKNFPAKDVDTVIVSAFSGTNNYTNPVYTDTLLTDQAELGYYTVFNKYFYPDSSYLVISTSKNDSFYITNIKIDDEVHEMEGTRRGCYGLHCDAFPHDATVNDSAAIYKKFSHYWGYSCSIYVTP